MQDKRRLSSFLGQQGQVSNAAPQYNTQLAPVAGGVKAPVAAPASSQSGLGTTLRGLDPTGLSENLK